MLFSTVFSLLVASTAFAQTPPGFFPATTTNLVVKYGSKTITPGQNLGKADTNKAPILGTTEGPLNGTFMFVMIDIDLPPQGSNKNRGVVLHGLLTDYKSAKTPTNGIYQLTTTATGPSSYFAPAPPAETPAWPHHYIELLYAQPANFKVPASQTATISSRLNFNITAFATEAKLGPLLRANYFLQVAGA